MDEIEHFWRKYDETQDLWRRFPAAYPARREMASLKARWDAGDRNVTCTDHGEDGGRVYSLKFTKEQRSALERDYLIAAPIRSNTIKNVDDAEFMSEVFVRIIEDWGAAIIDFQAITPDNQKERKRALKSVSVALTKFDQALSGLDSDALGYWYAHVVDALAPLGVQISPADNNMSSMLNHQLQAVVEGGELRKDLRTVISAIVNATDVASDGLPKHNHVEHDPRLKTAKALERLIIEHGILFDSTETGFAAVCLRAMFDLAGLDVEKVSYWLKQAKDDPDSYARFLQRMRERTQ